jgi:hypothetical protein
VRQTWPTHSIARCRFSTHGIKATAGGAIFSRASYLLGRRRVGVAEAAMPHCLACETGHWFSFRVNRAGSSKLGSRACGRRPCSRGALSGRRGWGNPGTPANRIYRRPTVQQSAAAQVPEARKPQAVQRLPGRKLVQNQPATSAPRWNAGTRWNASLPKVPLLRLRYLTTTFDETRFRVLWMGSRSIAFHCGPVTQNPTFRPMP